MEDEDGREEREKPYQYTASYSYTVQQVVEGWRSEIYYLHVHACWLQLLVSGLQLYVKLFMQLYPILEMELQVKPHGESRIKELCTSVRICDLYTQTPRKVYVSASISTNVLLLMLNCCNTKRNKNNNRSNQRNRTALVRDVPPQYVDMVALQECIASIVLEEIKLLYLNAIM